MHTDEDEDEEDGQYNNDMQLIDETTVLHSTTGTPTPSHDSPQTHQWHVLAAAASIASLGGITFGYDIGIISGALLQLRCTFHLSCYQQELIVTMLVAGALFSSFTGGFVLDQYGRKLTIIMNAFLFICGAVVLTLAQSFTVFIIGRFIVGFCVSLSAVSDCIYISEIASSSRRGMLVSMNEMGITLGILLAYLTNYLLVETPNGWRYMFAISAFPAALQLVGMAFLPESPRWLVTKLKDVRALKVIRVLWPQCDPEVEIEHLRNSISSESTYLVSDLFGKKENLRVRMLIGCGLVIFLQLSGQPTVLYYAPVLLKNIGYDSNNSATLATVGIGVVKVVFTFISLCTVDRLGRRTFLLIGVTLMTLSLVTLSGLTASFTAYPHGQCSPGVKENFTDGGNICQNIRYNTSVNYQHPHSTNIPPTSKLWDTSLVNGTTATSVNSIPSSIKLASLISLFVFVLGFAVGYGPIVWLLLSEIFPTGIKGRAVSAVTSVMWGTNMLVSMTFLDLMTAIGPFGIFLVYSMVGILSIFFIFHCVPETRGKSLEVLGMELMGMNGFSSSLGMTSCTCGNSKHVRLTADDDEDQGLLGSDDNLHGVENVTQC